MMKKSISTYVKVSLLTALLGLSGLPTMAITVEVATPGTLENSIFNLEDPTFPTLKIVGTLNADDILYLRSSTGRMRTVETLDLSEVTVVADGNVYATFSYTEAEDLIDNYSHTFYLSDETREETVTTTNGLGGRNFRITHYGNDLSGAFAMTSFKKIVMPNYVKKAGDMTFYKCADLTAVEFPAGLESVGLNAFQESAIESIDLSKVTEMKSFAFQRCYSLLKDTGETLDLSSLDSIPSYAFYYCSGCQAVKFSPTLSYIGDYAFNSTGLTEIVLPASLKTLGKAAFRSCNYLASVEILSTTLSIDYNMFEWTPWVNALQPEDDGIVYLNTTALRYKGNSEATTLTIREGTTDIGDEFLSNQNITSVTLPSTLRRIGNKAFSWCTAISDINMPSTVEYIGSEAFTNCKALKTITLPESIKSIGRKAFYDCTSLSGEITIPEGTEELGTDIFYGTGIWRITYLARHAVNPIVSNVQEPIFASDVERVIIGSNVEILPKECFEHCDNLQLVTFEERADDATLELGQGCFGDCDKLQTITLPKGKIVIGEEAFYSASKLETIETQGVITEIGESGFKSCSALTKISFPDGLLKVGGWAFHYCSNLQSAHLGNSVKYIGESAFDSCPLTDILFGNQLDSIGSSAFARTNLETIELGENVVKIGDAAFIQCSYLQSIDIPSGVKKIENGTFSWCTSLSSVTLPEGLEEIENDVFYRCESLKELVIPSTVKKIGKNIASSWSKLEAIESRIQDPASVEFAGDPFPGLYDYTVLRVPVGTVDAYRNTYPWNQFKNIKTDMYTLTYEVDGEVYKTVQMEAGGSITPEPEPYKEGYTFSGWSEIPEAMPDHDVTVTGSFTINTYTLTYEVDGEVYKTVQVEYGSSITPEPEPTKEGYIFSGWSEIPETMPANDVTVTGAFIVDGIQDILSEDDDYQIYTLDGKRINSLQRGVNIIRMSDGTTRTVYVK